MDDAVIFDGLTSKLISNPRAYETFEIFLNATGSQSSFILEWSYNTQLFKASTITQLSNEFELLLQTIVDAPAVAIKELFKKSAGVHPAELGDWNNTHAYYPKESNLFALIEQTANKYPDNTAISCNGQAISYSRLVFMAGQLANHLIEKGVKVGDIVGVSVNRSNEMIIAMLGIVRAGAVYLPLDPDYPKDRIEYMLADSDAKVLLLSKEHSGKFRSKAGEIAMEDIWDNLVNHKADVPEVNIKGTDLVYILYTSGSTGKPKGVKVRHFNLINFLISMGVKPGMSSNDKLLAVTTISFDVSVYELFVPLIHGAEVVIADKEASTDPRILLDIINNEAITILLTTPSTWSTIIDTGWAKPYPLKALCGGEALPKSLADKLLSRASEVWNMYGPTETTACTTLKQITTDDETINIGWPIHNAQVYILNEENEQVMPGVIGEIFIGGDGVTEGYLNLPDLTDERFIKNPFSLAPGATLYKTGDLGKFCTNGDIQYFGRTDQQVKIRGLRIELGEIETALSAQEEIKDVVAMAVDDAMGDAKLVAYIILEHHLNNFQTLITAWKENLKLKLPQYMIPASFIIVEEFPLTSNNKIDKKALTKIKPTNVSTTKIKALPETENEKLVYNIWAEILNISDFDIDDDFFEIGGHSLLAVKMMSILEKQTGNRLPLATLFESSTVKQLAKEIGLTEHLNFKTLVSIKPTGTKNPVYLIHGGGLNVLLFKYVSKYFDADQPVFGIQAIGLTDDTEVPQTLEEIATKHVDEILKRHPTGPYSLVGYSLGGYIAFEIAKQLQAMGKVVKMLGIIDTYAGSNSIPEPVFTRVIKKIRRQFNKIPFFAKSFINNPLETILYQWIVFKYKIQMTFVSNSVIAKEVLTARQMLIYKIYDTARAKYLLTPIDTKITLFRVKKRLYYLDDLIYLGWKPFTTKTVEIHEIPGDHKTFLYPPNDVEFANVVQNALDS
jgi:amino acid adenylation domain-containing protein